MKALIFNSGIGKRMGDLTQSRHKSMVSLGNGETILGRQVRIFADKGIREFVITTGAFGEQLKDVCENFRATQASDLKFYFVENPKYQETNYIYSMYLAGEYLDDDFLMLHGDLVFNEDLVAMVLESERASTCLINREKTLPEKDFKGRVRDELLKEVSISIFDEDCFALQPLYKLARKDLMAWYRQVAKFVERGDTNVYAENALNEILDEVKIYALSYAKHYIEEIDTAEDYERVKREIDEFEAAKGV